MLEVKNHLFSKLRRNNETQISQYRTFTSQFLNFSLVFSYECQNNFQD